MDGKTLNGQHQYFSYIEKIPATAYGYVQEEYTYGFEFSSVKFGQQDGREYYGALVLYVMPGTPAQRAGLKRGDWIISVNDHLLEVGDVESLYGDVARTFGIFRWSDSDGFTYDRQIEMDTAEPLAENNPVYRAETYTVGEKKVGYLVYNSFKAGINDDDHSYDDELRTLSAGTFSGVDEFVLDLRYNGGGLLSCARLMCAILGPAKVLSEDKFGYLEYNDGSKDYFTANNRQGNGNNLNLQRLFVLVSSNSASASEAVINLLDPYMDLIVIGRATFGKNVGSDPIKSTDGIWEMHPITCKIFNNKGKSDYAAGWIPNIEKGDVFDYDNRGYVTLQDHIYELGDVRERLFSIALDHIAGTKTYRAAAADAAKTYEPGLNSIDRKTARELIINHD
jgi:C-terminal processing protease CtpA/Prc